MSWRLRERWSTVEERVNDRLGPVVVKELRQQLRSGTFVVLFLTLQVVLSCWLGYLMILPSMSVESMTEAFWMVFAALLLVVVPMLGFGVIRRDERARHLELIFVTDLDSWAYVRGKWLSLALQATLMILSAIPYLLVRYWLGEVNVAIEMLVLFSCVSFGFSLLAIVIHLTGYRLISVRSLVPLFVAAVVGFFVAGMGMLPAGIFMTFASNRMSYGEELFVASLAAISAVIMGPLTVYMMIDAAATRMARATERLSDRQIRRRVRFFVALAAFSCLFSPFSVFWGALVIGVFVFGRVREGSDWEYGEDL